MDKPRNQDGSEEGPGLSGPDYFSVVIEWEHAADDNAAAPQDADDAVTARQIRHWDVVDEASAESFPASDPPAWGSSHAAPSQTTAGASKASWQAIEPSTWLRRHARGVALIGTAAVSAVVHGIRRRRRRAA